MQKIIVNEFLEIQFRNNVYCLFEKGSNLILDTTLELEQMCEKIIQHYLFYIKTNDVYKIENLIFEIRELKNNFERLSRC